jgi:hypothetical protein
MNREVRAMKLVELSKRVAALKEAHPDWQRGRAERVALAEDYRKTAKEVGDVQELP